MHPTPEDDPSLRVPSLLHPLRPHRFGPLAVALSLLAGCAATDGGAGRPQAPAMPPAWTAPVPQGATAPELRAWWKAFRDPTLDAMVEEALEKNLDLAAAARRLREARLQAGRAAVQFRPSFSAGARTLQDISATDTYFHASIDMAWELGLFGAGESIRAAADADADSAQADSQGVRVAVVADVVRNYLDLQAARRQLHLLDRMGALDGRAATLADVRQRTRIGSADDSTQARVRTAQTRAARAAPEEALARAAQALSVLLGRVAPDPAWTAPEAAEAAATLPPFAFASLPADLLRTRPDVHAAEAGVRKAAAGLGLARSELYPRIAIMGSLLYSYNITRNRRTTSDNAPAIGPVIDIPLFDWGRRRMQVDAQTQALEGAALGYERAVRTAVAEAEGALAALSAQQARADALGTAVAAWGERTEVARTRVRLGLASEYDALATQRALLQAESEQATARDARALAFVALYKALGGAPLPAEALDTAAAPASGQARGAP
ncbi:NodT family efflux transporter outer membrane factor (OMF) lipoprotein [Paracidovorax anthurii]|uniref:NodT family efflux transporter outer membrane factor (OMF) lipoprotein n=1 Tax=Paracidovorax anthurii TaxID=78229 RepID=A0A328ZSF2_9BURK|nr:NodT family efflux transporter outer membrane factor (OMF) lipoprotein [Paracidovorax anthurii]